MGLKEASTVKHFLTNELNYGDQCSVFVNYFGGLFWIANIARTGWRCEYGGTLYANSIAVIPNDHISVL